MIMRSTMVAHWVLIGAAVCALAVSYVYYAGKSGRLDAARDSVRGCEQLAAQIGQIRQAPQKARLTTRSADDLGTVVEKAAADAQLARDRVLRIDPRPAKRLGKTDYLDQATEVELVSVSLQQLVGFLCNLTASDGELGMSTLRLQMPHTSSDSTSNELWLADVILTQRIYAPTTPHP